MSYRVNSRKKNLSDTECLEQFEAWTFFFCTVDLDNMSVHSWYKSQKEHIRCTLINLLVLINISCPVQCVHVFLCERSLLLTLSKKNKKKKQHLFTLAEHKTQLKLITFCHILVLTIYSLIAVKQTFDNNTQLLPCVDTFLIVRSGCDLSHAHWSSDLN